MSLFLNLSPSSQYRIFINIRLIKFYHNNNIMSESSTWQKITSPGLHQEVEYDQEQAHIVGDRKQRDRREEPSFYSNASLNRNILVMLLLIVVGIICFYIITSQYQQRQTIIEKEEPHISKDSQGQISNFTRLPRILWIYTYHKWQGETAITRTMFHYFNHTGHKNGYEVRIVDSWTAYDWLSKPTIHKITKAIQNVKIDQTVCSMLKMALLMEHGGIMIGNLHFMMTHKDFKWIEKMFEDEEMQQYLIPPNQTQVYVPRITGTQKFDQNIFAAVPNSTFIANTFYVLQMMCITGHIKYNDEFGFFQRNQDLKIDYIPSSIGSAMTSIIHDLTLDKVQSYYNDYFNLQETKQPNFIDFRERTFEQSLQLLRQSQKKRDGKDLVLNIFEALQNILNKLLVQNQGQNIAQNSLLGAIMEAPENQRLLLKPWPDRQISLCLVYIEPLNSDEIKEASKVFEQQSYNLKQLIVFSSSADNESKELNNKIILKNSGNQVRNIQIALTQHCRHKGYAVLLRKGENFSTPQALNAIAEAVKDRSVMGATIDLKIGNETRKSKLQYHNYSRTRDGVLNPKLQLMNGIINHMRIFSTDAFRYIPQFEFRDAYGVYYQDRIIILSSLLELLAPFQFNENKYKHYYTMKAYSHIFHFPNKMVIIEPSVYINVKNYEQTIQSQIIKTKVRMDVESLSLALVQTQAFGVPFSKQLVFNKGEQYVPMTKKKGPQLIPKVIYQAWLGGQMPTAKKYFFEKAQRLHPNYQMVLYTAENITRENFPEAHDIMHTLLNYQLAGNSGYSKFATVTDLLRHELLYRKGGFWRDAGMNLFKNVFDHFTRYKLVIGAEVTIRHRWNQGMCFFANEPFNENMQRVSKYQNINRMRYYSFPALNIAGPFDFRQVIIGDQEQHPDILMLQYEYYYPAQSDHYPFGDKCLKKVEDVDKEEKYEFQYKGYVYLPGCQSFYPEAFGQDHNKFGVSWGVKSD